jgi:hypothetical protein
LLGADGALRPELAAERAIGVARELLLQGVPLGLVQRAAQELEGVARLAGLGTDWPATRQRLTALAAAPAYQQQPLVGQLLSAGAAAVRRPEELAALILHLKRVVTLGHFEALLGGMTALERERAQRAAGVLKHRKRQGPDAR